MGKSTDNKFLVENKKEHPKWMFFWSRRQDSNLRTTRKNIGALISYSLITACIFSHLCLPFSASGSGRLRHLVPNWFGPQDAFVCYKIKKNTRNGCSSGRGDRTRTCGILVPNQALYQTELRLVIMQL